MKSLITSGCGGAFIRCFRIKKMLVQKKVLVQINKKIVSCWCKKKGCERIANKGAGGGDVTSLSQSYKNIKL